MAHFFECAICLENIKTEDEIETTCGHKYHKSCFMDLTIKNKYVECSLCRRKFEEDWFLGLKDNFLSSVDDFSMNPQDFEDSWKWWTEHFLEIRRIQDLENDENVSEQELDEWQEFLLPPGNDAERLEGFNLGSRPREAVNPEQVVWEGEIEDLFEEAAQMDGANQEIEIPPEDLEAIDDFVRNESNEN